MYADGHREAAREVHHSIGDMGLRILAAGFIFVGLISFGSYFNDNQDISRTAAWPTTTGKLEEIGSTQVIMPIIDKFVPIICPFAKYSYVLDNKTYTGQKNGGPCLSIIRDITFRKPEVEKVKKPESEEKKKQHQNRHHGLFFNGFNGNRFNRNRHQQQIENQPIFKREPVIARDTDVVDNARNTSTTANSASVPSTATTTPVTNTTTTSTTPAANATTTSIAAANSNATKTTTAAPPGKTVQSNDPVYKPIKVRYDKDHVENSLLDPAVLQTDNSQLYTSVTLVVVGSIFLIGNILNGYMARAAMQDPLMSLDSALAHQKQNRPRR